MLDAEIEIGYEGLILFWHPYVVMWLIQPVTYNPDHFFT